MCYNIQDLEVAMANSKKKHISIRTKKILVVVLSVVLVLIVGGIVGFNLYADSLLNRMNIKNEIDKNVVNVVESHRNIDNIALLGIDSDNGTGLGSRSDVMKLISLDFDNKKLKITSLQRDNIVYQPLMDRYEKLNHAYWRNGVEGTLSSINYNFDLDVTKYVLFDFDSVEEIVDILGGVNIYLSGAEASYMGFGGEGSYHLNGSQTLAFSRIRSIDSDYERMNRQTRVIDALIHSFKDNNPFELLDIVNQVLPYIETNIPVSTIKSYLTNVITFDLNNIEQYQFPANGYDSQLTTLSLYGYSPQYVLKDFSGEVELLHHNIYNPNDKYTASENVLKVEREILALAGY